MSGIRTTVAYIGGLLLLFAMAMMFNAHHVLGATRVNFRNASAFRVQRAEHADDIVNNALSHDMLNHTFSADGSSSADKAFFTTAQGMLDDAEHLQRKAKNRKPGDPDFTEVNTTLRALLDGQVLSTKRWNDALVALAEKADAVTLESATKDRKAALDITATEAMPVRHKLAKADILVFLGTLLLAAAFLELDHNRRTSKIHAA